MNKREKGILKSDINSMTTKEIIDNLEYDLAMRLFNPLTGDVISPIQLKDNNDSYNYSVYVAISKAIDILKSVGRLENENEQLTNKIDDLEDKLLAYNIG